MIIRNINVNKLHDELVNSGIKPYPVFTLENGDGEFAFPEGTNMELAQEIIDKHDNSPLELKANITLEERIEILEQELAETKLVLKQAKLTK